MKKLMTICFFVLVFGASWANGLTLPFEDGFENIAVGDYPDENGWQNMYSGSNAYVTTEDSYAGEKCFKLQGQYNWSRVDYVLTEYPDHVTWEVAMKTTAESIGAGATVPWSGDVQNPGSMHSSRNAVYIRPTEPPVMRWYGGPGEYEDVMTVELNRWYRVTVVIDFLTPKALIYVDSTLELETTKVCPRHYYDPDRGQWYDLDNFMLHAGNRESPYTGYFDDVRISELGPCNTAPVADAGDDQTVYAWIDGIAEVQLDGSDSNDVDGDELTYLWTWTIDANEMTATGVDPNIEMPVGVHEIELVVNDGTADSEPDYVTITVVEAAEADVHIVPRVINRRSRIKRVMAIIRLPEGIRKDDVVCESFELYAGGLDADPIGAIWERVIGWGNMTRVFALFDKGELVNAVPNDGRVELIVVGELTSGQYVYGSDTVRIIRPRQRRRLRLR